MKNHGKAHNNQWEETEDLEATGITETLHLIDLEGSKDLKVYIRTHTRQRESIETESIKKMNKTLICFVLFHFLSFWTPHSFLTFLCWPCFIVTFLPLYPPYIFLSTSIYLFALPIHVSSFLLIQRFSYSFFIPRFLSSLLPFLFPIPPKKMMIRAGKRRNSE